MRPARALAAAVSAGAIVAGCSSAGPGPSADPQATLRTDVLSLTRAAAAHDWPAADAALAQLRTDLSAARASGALGAARDRTLRTRISAVAADLAAKTASNTTSAPPSSTHSTRSPAPKPTPKPAPTPPSEKKHGHDKHHGHRHGDD
jgi:hypothetical protein